LLETCGVSCSTDGLPNRNVGEYYRSIYTALPGVATRCSSSVRKRGRAGFRATVEQKSIEYARFLRLDRVFKHLGRELATARRRHLFILRAAYPRARKFKPPRVRLCARSMANEGNAALRQEGQNVSAGLVPNSPHELKWHRPDTQPMRPG
jgi:hypothetical protein